MRLDHLLSKELTAWNYHNSRNSYVDHWSAGIWSIPTPPSLVLDGTTETQITDVASLFRFEGAVARASRPTLHLEAGSAPTAPLHRGAGARTTSTAP